MIPYGTQTISEEDIKAVSEALKGDFLSTGPLVLKFEAAFAKYVGSKYAVAVSSGTAALHLSCLASNLKQGDEVITSPMTFVATANAALYCQAKPVFVDVNGDGLIDESKIEEKISGKTKAIIPVHYSGLPCSMEVIHQIAQKHNLIVIEDAAHALGAEYKGKKIGSCAYSDMTIFSFHPVKHITTGEGGMITTNSKELYEKLCSLRNHGLMKSHKESWLQELEYLGYNYRLTDFQCALGLSQLEHLGGFLKRRKEIAAKYDQAFRNLPITAPQSKDNSYHLYVIQVKDSKTRLKLFNHLRKNDIFCQVHYLPIYQHPYYQRLGYKKGLCREAEAFYERILSIPIHPKLTSAQQDFVIEKIKEGL
ncbi:MAG TPA: UDP-4-amino-4,6-dideoxy-N-acetyl-beta-L-altrosamine transaminase [Candidatus Nanoarchaeia archaeon]|nr:UDP-4-amino-4,6-dideoxy-N-acetyl-beta-L-altrosamine transaminase [Candidatus Nanoarchaeia archaeon]